MENAEKLATQVTQDKKNPKQKQKNPTQTVD
jgi:hypothetical protein